MVESTLLVRFYGDHTTVIILKLVGCNNSVKEDATCLKFGENISFYEIFYLL